MKIKLEGGKYVWSFDELTGRQEAYRFGELWRDLNGDNLTLAMGHRIATLEAALAEAHRIILHELDNGRTPYLLPVDNGGKGLGYFEDVLAGLTTDRS
ncbi:MAG: hypothetical protein ACRC47_09935 [Shewanella sp.]